jgi:2,3-bisphosphoglycerate-independent phosphoglycerate mutase
VLKRRTEVDDEACRALSAAIGPFSLDGISVEFTYNSDHQGIVTLRSAQAGVHPSADVTDSDPYVPGRHVVRPQPLVGAQDAHGARHTAAALEAWLAHVFHTLDAHPVNAARRERGEEPANFLLVKWSSAAAHLTPFADLNGLRGASVSSGVTYRGISAVLGMDWYGCDYLPDWTEDLRARIALGARVVAEGHGFVHVHTKAPDVAGHTKDPARKRDVIEALDAAIPALWETGLVRTTSSSSRETTGRPAAPSWCTPATRSRSRSWARGRWSTRSPPSTNSPAPPDRSGISRAATSCPRR